MAIRVARAGTPGPRPGARDGTEEDRGDARERHRVAVALLALYVISVGARTLLAWRVDSPFVFNDELGYSRLAQSIASGHGLTLFGRAGFSYPPLYSLLLAPIYLLHASGPSAYHWIKVVNAAALSSAVFLTYAIARSVLARRDAFIVALLGTLAPLMLYSGLVLSENLAYPCALLAIWATLVTVRAPSFWLDALLLVAIGLATAARVELFALFPAGLTAIAGAALLSRPGVGSRSRLAVTRLARHPLLLGVAGIGAAAAALIAVTGHSVWAVAGRYSDLNNGASVDPLSFVWAVVQHVGEFDLALGVVPFVGTLVAIDLFLRGARSEVASAFAAVALAVTLWLAAEVAYDVVLTAHSIDQPRIHERYLIYLEPMFLTAFVAAFRGHHQTRGRRRFLWAWLIAAALPAAIPFSTVVNQTIIGDTFGLAPFARGLHGRMLPLAHETLLVVLVASVLGSSAFVLRARMAVAVALVAVLFVGWSLAAETRIVLAARDDAAVSPHQRDWVDRTDPSSPVVMISTPRTSEVALLETAFFNLSVSRLYSLCTTMIEEGDFGDELVRLGPGGVVVGPAGPLEVDYAIVASNLILRGAVVARDPKGGLVLVRTSNGRVTLARAPRGGICG